MPEPDGAPRLRIARIGPGRYELAIPRRERLLIRGLLRDLERLVDDRDPATRRLFPTAYAEDPDKEAEYQSMMAGELVASRFEAIAAVRRTLNAEELDAGALERWLEAINSLRLVLGTRLEVTEEPPQLAEEDALAPAHVLYDYLGWLMEQGVRAFSEDLP